MCAMQYFLYVEFSDFYVNQSLAGQTISKYNFTADSHIILELIKTKFFIMSHIVITNNFMVTAH
jgi:hypothetical protein